MYPKPIILIFFLSFALCSAGCGYHLSGPVNPMLDGISTIAIPYFKNKTFEPEAETIFTYAFVNEFVESRRLRVVGEDEADLVLFGTIKELDEESISYTRDDKALEYRATVTLNITVQNRRTGAVVWKRKLKHGEEYYVGSSPDYYDEESSNSLPWEEEESKRGAEVLQGDGIVFTEAAKRDALTRLAEDLAERAHDSIMQGF